MRTEFFRQNSTRRIQVYIELRDMWIGTFIATNAVYVCVFGFVLRVARREEKS